MEHELLSILEDSSDELFSDGDNFEPRDSESEDESSDGGGRDVVNFYFFFCCCLLCIFYYRNKLANSPKHTRAIGS